MAEVVFKATWTGNYWLVVLFACGQPSQGTTTNPKILERATSNSSMNSRSGAFWSRSLVIHSINDARKSNEVSGAAILLLDSFWFSHGVFLSIQHSPRWPQVAPATRSSTALWPWYGGQVGRSPQMRVLGGSLSLLLVQHWVKLRMGPG